MAPIPLLEPCLRGNEQRYLAEAIARNEIAQGAFVERFEREFAAYVGSRYAVAVASGTAAIHLALCVLDVEPGDDVLCPTLTFVATANPILYLGARPWLIDSERETWNMDPDLVLRILKARRPKAVIVVHLLGHPANMEPIMEACDRYGVPVIEDAAESLGAKAYGRHVGTFGKLGCFSFNGNKIITTGGGGMVVTDDADLATRVRHLSRQARLPGVEYRHDVVGYNYRLSNVAAAIGCAQLEQLPAFLKRKREIAAVYDEYVYNGPAWAQPSFWLYTAQTHDRDALIATLAAEGIESRPLWTPLHRLTMFTGYGPVAEDLFAHAVSLPSSVSLTEKEQLRVMYPVAA